MAAFVRQLRTRSKRQHRAAGGCSRRRPSRSSIGTTSCYWWLIVVIDGRRQTDLCCLCLWVAAGYCDGGGVVPELTEMEVNSLRLTTQLRLSVDEADAVARCSLRHLHFFSFSFLYEFALCCFLNRFHNQNLRKKAPRSMRRLREKCARKTCSPFASKTKVAVFDVPPALRSPQAMISVKYTDILGQASVLLRYVRRILMCFA